MKKKVRGLIEILFDTNAREDERHDAAMYLGHFNDKTALEALIKIGSNSSSESILQDACGESIGRIYVMMSVVDIKIFDILTPLAQETAFAYIYSHKPELLKEEFRNKLSKKFGFPN